MHHSFPFFIDKERFKGKHKKKCAKEILLD
jgi:hypothetical protein